MPLLVDGDNLLGCWPGRTRSDGDKRDLVRLLAVLAREDGRRIVVVFDGAAPPVAPAGCETVYAGGGRRADDVILERLRRETDPRGWTVVTNDRSLGDQCRWIGARVERCERLRGRLERGASEDKPPADADLGYWRSVFSDSTEDETS